MARKKSRQPHAAPRPTPSTTAVQPASAVVGVTTVAPPAVALQAEPSPKTSDAPVSTTPAIRFFVKLFQVFASLQLAIVLLSIFTLVLIEATLLESWYSTQVAQDAIYHTWWFALLLTLLGANVICAALKKIDSKKWNEGGGWLFLGLLGTMALVVIFLGLISDGIFYGVIRKNPGLEALVEQGSAHPAWYPILLAQLAVALLATILPWTPLDRYLARKVMFWQLVRFAVVGLLWLGAILFSVGKVTGWLMALVVIGILTVVFAVGQFSGVSAKLDEVFVRFWPWKKHQTGFLVTHLGLIILVFGAFLTAAFGIDGQMIMLDTTDRDIQARFGVPNRTNILHLGSRHRIDVFQLKLTEKNKEDLKALLRRIDHGETIPREMQPLIHRQWSMSLSPGSFPWYDEKDFQIDLPVSLQFFKFLSSPFPGFTRSLEGGPTLQVSNFLPYTERWPYSPAEAKEKEKGFPALQLKLFAPMAGKPIERWVVGVPDFDADASPLAAEIFILPEKQLLEEFLNPPLPEKMGKDGQLVLLLDGKQVMRINVDKAKLGETMPVPGSDLKVKLTECGNLLQQFFKDRKPEELPQYPMVKFELSKDGDTGEYVSCARLPHRQALEKGKEIIPVAAWFHHPDFRWGRQDRMGALQFLQAPDGKVYYRVFGKEGLKERGQEIDVNDSITEHKLPLKMELRFQIGGYIARAVERETLKPRNLKPGAESQDRLEPAVRGTLTIDGKEQPFWARFNSPAARLLPGGADIYLVRYQPDSETVEFSTTLLRAKEIKDPGTDRSAAFESEILLHATEGNAERTTRHRIYMNHTLDHGYYRLFQANYRGITDPESLEPIVDKGRKVSLSGLTVAFDPGLMCKHVGWSLVVLGIVLMFYMKAYFFKSSVKRATEQGHLDLRLPM
jgi:hypothetical protein